MINDTNNIVAWLYNNYYENDSTPEDLISSHWKLQHSKVKVGSGFGDLQNESVAYKLCSWLTIAGYICRLPKRKSLLEMMPKAMKLARKMGVLFSYDCFRQLCSLNLILQELSHISDKKKNFLVIGDGYGYLSALIEEFVPGSTICLVDLGKTLLFQANYCQIAYPSCSHYLVTKDFDLLSCPDVDFLYCPIEYLDKLNILSFDVAINIASMQEMNRKTIGKCFQFLRQNMSSHNLFYCCNREEKKMPGGEISSFFSYPWRNHDVHIVDELCPWHLYFVSMSREKNGPRLFNVRIPFVHYFDGSHRHRLTVLQPEK